MFAAPSSAATALQRATPPAGVDAARPTVSGTLIAKPGAGNGPAVCKGIDRSGAAAAAVARGLVVCTEEGQLVLLELSAGTRFVNRNWNRLGLAQLSDGDHLNAWGGLREGGAVLSPTVVVQDTSKPRPARLTRVIGTLVAKPQPGVAPSEPVACREQPAAGAAAAVMQGRGLVICTAAGHLVLLQLSASTRILTIDGGAATIASLRDGDRIVAAGALTAGGAVLNPTTSVRDTDIQRARTASQDFIAGGGSILTLFVLQSDAGGPVEGQVHADGAADAHVTLCGGRAGSWTDLHQGLTIDITNSIFNRRTMTYVDADTIHVVSC
jgi:hypothetical protein